MKLLALDTSTLACSVALAIGDAVSERHELEPRAHSRRLLPMIRELLGDAGIAAADLDAVILGNGPGSFVGLRIAASVAQGLCFAGPAQLVPVSSLAAVAVDALAAGRAARVLVAQDARMGEVYLAGFAAGNDDLPREIVAPRLQPAAPVAEANPETGFAGAGWDRYPALLDANRERLGPRLPVDYPRAAALLPLGRAALAAGAAVAPEALEPAYLRERVAEPPAPGRS